MKYVTIVNRAKNARRFFAASTDRAVELAVQFGYVRKAENANVVYDQDVCDTCFTDEGPLALQLGPRRLYIVALGQGITAEQGSGQLHSNEQCTVNMRTIRDDVELDYGEFTPTGFAPR